MSVTVTVLTRQKAVLSTVEAVSLAVLLTTLAKTVQVSMHVKLLWGELERIRGKKKKRNNRKKKKKKKKKNNNNNNNKNNNNNNNNDDDDDDDDNNNTNNNNHDSKNK